MPILVETARLWMSLGYLGEDEKFHIDGITGPDEYSAIVRDNVYTNLAAARNLEAAAAVAQRWKQSAQALDVTEGEIATWRSAASRVAVPFDDERQVHQQDLGSTSRELWDFEASEHDGGYPLLLKSPYMEIYRKQVVKQADLILAMHWFGNRFTLEEKARAFEYYDAITVRDSSLSACTQAIVAAEVGHLDLAADYLTEAALMDIRDLEHNTRDGLHIASLAGSWLAVVAGFGGMRDYDGHLSFRPHLAPGWKRLAFRLVWHGAHILVEVGPDEVTYTASETDDDGVEIRHVDETLLLNNGKPVRRPCYHVEPFTPRPTQPAGREPMSADELR